MQVSMKYLLLSAGEREVLLLCAGEREVFAVAEQASAQAHKDRSLPIAHSYL